MHVAHNLPAPRQTARVMTVGVAVRRAVIDDWAHVRAVRLAALADSPSAYITTLAEAREFPDALWQERISANPHFIAVSGQDPVGLAAVLFNQPLPEVVGMWVAPDFRGHGVVDELIGATAAASADRGAQELRLWVVEGNQRAEAAYIRNGFLRTGRLQAVPGRSEEIEFEMARLLP